MYKLYGEIFSGIPKMLVLCNFFQNIQWFQTKCFTRLLELLQLYKQNPLEKFLIFTIYQKYTLALTLCSLSSTLGTSARAPDMTFGTNTIQCTLNCIVIALMDTVVLSGVQCTHYQNPHCQLHR